MGVLEGPFDKRRHICHNAMDYLLQGGLEIMHSPEAIIHGSHPILFLAAIATAVLVAWLMRREEKPLRWALMIAMVITGFVLGSKVYGLVAGDFAGLQGEGHTGKSMLGGVLGAALGLVLLRQVLHCRGSEAQAWALALPAAVLVGRVGCLFAGCCHGTVTQSGLGITYPAGSVPFLHQLAGGQLHPGAGNSLPVHPAQLYEMIFLVVLLWLLATVQNRLKRDNSLFFLMAGGYTAFRFLQEFVRYGGEATSGLKPVQWGLAVFGALFFAALWLSEKGLVKDPPDDEKRCTARLPGLALAYALVFLAGYVWASPLERVCLLVGSAPALAYGVQALSRWVSRLTGAPLPHQIPAGSALAIAVMLPLGMAPVTEGKGKDGDTMRYEGGGGAGQWEYEEICGDERFKDRFAAFHARAEYRAALPDKQALLLGLSAYGMPVTRAEGPQPSPDEDRDWDFLGPPLLQTERATPYQIYGVEPYAIWDFDWGAVGGGAHVSVVSPDNTAHLFPSAYLRAGPKNVGFLEASLLHGPHAPMAIPFQLGLGAAIGDKVLFRAGYGGLGGVYIQPTIKIPAGKSTVKLIPLINLAATDESPFYYVGFTVAIEIPN
jgi:prolipoprotein diacylglyceryltransferase